ncbi:hypothetical protein NORO109296_05530 [Nocardiopsis rhodophaea]
MDGVVLREADAKPADNHRVTNARIRGTAFRRVAESGLRPGLICHHLPQSRPDRPVRPCAADRSAAAAPPRSVNAARDVRAAGNALRSHPSTRAREEEDLHVRALALRDVIQVPGSHFGPPLKPGRPVLARRCLSTPADQWPVFAQEPHRTRYCRFSLDPGPQFVKFRVRSTMPPSTRQGVIVKGVRHCRDHLGIRDREKPRSHAIATGHSHGCRLICGSSNMNIVWVLRTSGSRCKRSRTKVRRAAASATRTRRSRSTSPETSAAWSTSGMSQR